MLLKEEDGQEFKKLYEEVFKEPISDQEAGIMASRLMALYEALAHPLPNEAAQFTDSLEGGRLDLEVGGSQVTDEPPASEKVAF